MYILHIQKSIQPQIHTVGSVCFLSKFPYKISSENLISTKRDLMEILTGNFHTTYKKTCSL